MDGIGNKLINLRKEFNVDEKLERWADELVKKLELKKDNFNQIINK